MKKIKNICSRFSSGNFISAEKISDSGKFPVYGGNGLRGYTENFNFDGECAIIGRQGAYCGNVKFFSGKGHMTEHAIVAVANEESFTKFLYYKFCLMNFGKYASQSAQPGLSAEFISNLEIDLPPLEVQKQIGNFLYSLDKKIALNKKINATLEDMAKTLYEYYFVQFDFPDENGKPYKSSGGKMIFSPELQREIPEGWEVKKLSELCKFIRGVTYDKKEILNYPEKNYIPIFRANNISNCRLNFENLVYVPKKYVSDEQILKLNEILITMSSGSTEHIGKLSRFDYESKYSFGAFCSKISVNNLSEKYFIYEHLISNEFKSYVRNMCLGTNIKNLNNEHLKKAFIILPAISVLKKYDDSVDKFFKMIQKNNQENNLLENLRDFLLPLLMNGQVTFAD